MNTKTPKQNGSGEPSSQSVSRIERRSRFGRTLLVASVFALLAMICVPTPNFHGRHYGGGYRLIFDPSNTSVAFFQLLVNVAFAALLGAILANVLPKIPRRFWQWTWRVAVAVSILFGGLCLFYFEDAAKARAKSDRDYASECWATSKRCENWSENAPLLASRRAQLTQVDYLRYAADSSHQAAQYWRNAATNYRLCNNTASALEVEQLAKTADERTVELERRRNEAGKKVWAQFPDQPIKRALPVATPSPAIQFDPSTASPWP
jgi:hypothetical protein